MIEIKNIVKTAGEKVILVRVETCPDDIHGMICSQGVLTLRGGMTSHAAVVAKGMGKPCVAGCEDLTIDLKNETLTTKDGKVYKKNEIISMDGSTGEIMEGEIKTVEPNKTNPVLMKNSVSEAFNTIFGVPIVLLTKNPISNAHTTSSSPQAFKFT